MDSDFYDKALVVCDKRRANGGVREPVGCSDRGTLVGAQWEPRSHSVEETGISLVQYRPNTLEQDEVYEHRIPYFSPSKDYPAWAHHQPDLRMTASTANMPAIPATEDRG